MRLFLDANILVSVLNKEYPLYTYTGKILSLSANKKDRLFTTSVALAIAYYYAEKKHGRHAAKNKIDLLVNNIEIADCGRIETNLAIKNKKIHDFEDGLQYYAALHSKCNCIITADLNDYYFSDIVVLDPEAFLESYVQ